MNNKKIRLVCAALVTFFVVYAGPYGINLFTSILCRWVLPFVLCLQTIGTLYLIERILKALRLSHTPEEDLKFKFFRIFVFVVISILLNTTINSLSLLSVDYLCHVNHMSWHQVYNIFLTFLGLSLFLACVMGSYNCKASENENLKKQNLKLKQRNKEMENIIEVKGVENIERSSSVNSEIIVSLKNTNGLSIELDSRDFVVSEKKGNYNTVWYLKNGKVESLDHIRMTCEDIYAKFKGNDDIEPCSRNSILNISYIESFKKEENQEFVKMRGIDKCYHITSSHVIKIRGKYEQMFMSQK